MKSTLKKNLIFPIFLLLATPGLEAVKRTVVQSTQKDEKIGANEDTTITPLPDGIHAMVAVYLGRLVHYSQKVSVKTVDFFNKESGKSYEQDVVEFEVLLDEIKGITREIPTTHPILASLKSLSQKLEDTQQRWVYALRARTIGDIVKEADEIALKNRLMADNIFGPVQSNKRRDHGIKSRLEAAGAVGELALLKQLVHNIDSVFNFDGKQVGLDGRVAKAQYLRHHKGFAFSLAIPKANPVILSDCWNGKTQLL